MSFYHGMDVTTGAFCHEVFVRVLEKHVALARRCAFPVALMIIRFEPEGHKARAELPPAEWRGLARATEILAGTLRDSDIVGRLSHSELAVILPCTLRAGAMAAARRCLVSQAEVEARTGAFGETVSVRIAVCDLEQAPTAAHLLAKTREELDLADPTTGGYVACDLGAPRVKQPHAVAGTTDASAA